MSDMYVYRNKNTDEVVKSDGARWRLERLPNWERIVGDDPTEAATEVEAEAEAEAGLQLEVPVDLSELGEAQVAVDGPDVDQVEHDDVPDGVVTDVLAWVDEDADRARAALEVEQQREKPRATLVGALELIIKVCDEADGE